MRAAESGLEVMLAPLQGPQIVSFRFVSKPMKESKRTATVLDNREQYLCMRRRCFVASLVTEQLGTLLSRVTSVLAARPSCTVLAGLSAERIAFVERLIPLIDIILLWTRIARRCFSVFLPLFTVVVRERSFRRLEHSALCDSQ